MREHFKGTFNINDVKYEDIRLITNYITQQEKQEKLLELYRKIYHISPMKNETKESYWARVEYLDNKIKELEK